MVHRFVQDGLALHIIKLDGKLHVQFERKSAPTSRFTLISSDAEDTQQIRDARQTAFGQAFQCPGLEVFFEEANGCLELKFEGANGGMSSMSLDGTSEEESMEVENVDLVDDTEVKAEEQDAMLRDVNVVDAIPVDDQGGATERTETAVDPPSVIDTATQVHIPSEGYIDVFKTFDKPDNFDYEKRCADPASDFRTYKHIYLEGTRTDENYTGEKGRLHIDRTHNELFWEEIFGFSDNGGGQLILDWFKPPPFSLEHGDVDDDEYQGVLGLQLYHETPQRRGMKMHVDFSMYFASNEPAVFGNNVGTGDERFYFEGPDRFQVVFDALQEYLDVKFGSSPSPTT